MRKVIVDTGRKRYPIHIGAGLSCEAGRLAADVTGPVKAALITDDNVDRIWSERITESLKSSGFVVSRHVIPNGEISKNIENYIKILSFFLTINFEGRHALCFGEAWWEILPDSQHQLT